MARGPAARRPHQAHQELRRPHRRRLRAHGLLVRHRRLLRPREEDRIARAKTRAAWHKKALAQAWHDKIPFMPRSTASGVPIAALPTFRMPARYTPMALLGKGGGGEVWSVRDKVTQRDVALKV